MNITQQNSVLGVLVADAAALGLHWMYDLERLHKVIAKNSDQASSFIDPVADHYAGKVGYFAHAGKQAGEQSHYGEAYLLNLGHMVTEGEYQVRKFQQEFIATFGPGGTYSGYIDKPTGITLKNLQNIDFSNDANRNTEATGADDDQIPALTPVAALCAYGLKKESSDTVLETAIRLTNNNNLAVSCGLYFSRILMAVLTGASISDAFSKAAAFIPELIKDSMENALNMEPGELDAVAGIFGQSCGLKNTMPLSAYILKNSHSFKEATELNILAGGDSCGRAIMVGAIAGAHYGIGSAKGIPYSWLLRLKRHEDISALLN